MALLTPAIQALDYDKPEPSKIMTDFTLKSNVALSTAAQTDL